MAVNISLNAAELENKFSEWHFVKQTYVMIAPEFSFSAWVFKLALLTV